MAFENRTPLYHDDDHELLGFIAEENNSWVAQTVFGYTIERTDSKKDAERALHQQGRKFLKGVWQYFDKDDQEWFSCVIKEANEHRVTVVRTDSMGTQDPHSYKVAILLNPTENTLVKSH